MLFCLTEDLYRIPDQETVPAFPPLLIVEISSPDDRLDAMLQKLKEYRVWGAHHIWLIEPELKRMHVYEHGSLREVSLLELPQFGFAITTEQVFA